MRRSYVIMFMLFFVTLQLSARDFLDLRWDVPGDFEEPRWMKWIAFIFIAGLVGIALPFKVWYEASESKHCGRMAEIGITAFVGLPLGIISVVLMYHLFMS